jgi:hypothetical protein
VALAGVIAAVRIASGKLKEKEKSTEQLNKAG